MKMSEVTDFLETAYGVLNQKYFEGKLPFVVITVQSSPKTYGTYTPWDSWKGEDKGYKEINISAETLNRSVDDTIATLIHEMVHFYCHINHIKDTSRNNTYHNKNFKREAEQRGLIIEYDPKIGYSITSPSESLVAFVEEQGWNSIDIARIALAGRSGGKKANVRKYLCPECKCSVRATKEVNIGCLDCCVPMLLVEK